MSNENKENTSPNITPEFSKIRTIFWPIHNYELKKFLPTSFMMFFILFIYTIVRDSKDSLISADTYGGGAALLPFIKTYLVFPTAIVFMAAFVKLSNKLSREKLFYTIVTFFVIYFVLFCFVLYPFSDYIHMSHDTIDKAQAWCKSIKYETIGNFLSWFVAIIGNWSYSMFFVMAELWGSVVLTTLFWQFANMITKITETKRFYPLFALIGNISLLFSGAIIKIASKNSKNFGASLKVIAVSILICGIALLLTYKWMQKNVLTDPRLYDPRQEIKKKNKPKMGFWKSMKYITTSPYLLKITTIMVGYGVTMVLFENMFKAQVTTYSNDDANVFQNIMGTLSMTTGIITMIMTLVGINIIGRFKWRTAALITPIVLLIMGTIFFIPTLMCVPRGPGVSIIVGITVAKSTIFALVTIGLLGDAAAKGVKYAFFDPTLQMTYMPLDAEVKTKGQAAISIIGGRLGKSGGAFLITILLSIFGAKTPTDIVGAISIIFFILIGLWIMSVVSLSKEYEQRTKEYHAEVKRIIEEGDERK